MDTENFEKRFGMIAVEQGFVSSEQVSEALKLQLEENLEKNSHRFIGKILIDLGYLQQPQLKQVLELMGVYH
ncbi:hypothetical protein ACFL9T_13515 [Thermodesulfobacteriota bacterium]